MGKLVEVVNCWMLNLGLDSQIETGGDPGITSTFTATVLWIVRRTHYEYQSHLLSTKRMYHPGKRYMGRGSYSTARVPNQYLRYTGDIDLQAGSTICGLPRTWCRGGGSTQLPAFKIHTLASVLSAYPRRISTAAVTELKFRMSSFMTISQTGGVFSSSVAVAPHLHMGKRGYSDRIENSNNMFLMLSSDYRVTLRTSNPDTS